MQWNDFKQECQHCEMIQGDDGKFLHTEECPISNEMFGVCDVCGGQYLKVLKEQQRCWCCEDIDLE